MEVTMISRDIEISIAGGVAETKDAYWRLLILPLYILRTTFSWMDSDNVYGVMAAAPMTSFY